MLIYTIQLSKVTVLGAAGGIGQPLSLLLKLNPRVTDLALYDIRLAPGTSSSYMEGSCSIWRNMVSWTQYDVYDSD